jgi:ABC-type multidrug transport system ATPase subunit
MAVDAIDFDVERGEAFGFLGPNGAGKTWTMRLIGPLMLDIGYLIVLGVAALALAATRLERLLLK